MTAPLLPGATIGILGGGQLGRMMARSAHALGYKVHIMDPDPQCSARVFADHYIQGSWSQPEAAAELARSCDVVTLEIEQLSAQSLDAAQQLTPVRPDPRIMSIVRDRIVQKSWLRDSRLPLGPWAPVHSLEQLTMAAAALGPNFFLKSATGGYDGRSQAKLSNPSSADLESAWALLGSRPCVAEQALTLRREISVLVARSTQGEVSVFPSAFNHHENQILVWSVLPSSVPPETERAAQAIARAIAENLELEGILVVELFLTDSGEILVNELAPRPHNSYHASERACATGQFEQAIRAVCGLPLGDTELVQPAAIANLLGDLWLEREPRFDRALAVRSVSLHLYGKHEPRAGRKMGHLSAIGETPEQAVERVMEAFHAL